MKRPEEPDLAILDGDIIIYRAACWADKHGSSFSDLENRIAFDVKFWTPSFTPRHINALSCKAADNFRYKVFANYKSNRKGKPKPDNFINAMDIMKANHPTVSRDCLEADDLIGMGMSSGLAVGVTLDKDLMTCPGWFWNPDKLNFPVYLDMETADRNFYRQWLMGDSTDGIPGVLKVGKVKAEKYVSDCKYANLTAMCLQVYKDRGHDYDYAIQQARLVRILRDGEYDKITGEISLWKPFQASLDRLKGPLP